MMEMKEIAKVNLVDEYEGDEAPEHIMVRKIDNGFIIEVCCCDENQKLFVENLSKAPQVMARMFKLKGKGRDEIKDKVKVDKMEDKFEDGKFKLKLKMTN